MGCQMNLVAKVVHHLKPRCTHVMMNRSVSLSFSSLQVGGFLWLSNTRRQYCNKPCDASRMPPVTCVHSIDYFVFAILNLHTTPFSLHDNEVVKHAVKVLANHRALRTSADQQACGGEIPTHKFSARPFKRAVWSLCFEFWSSFILEENMEEQHQCEQSLWS